MHRRPRPGRSPAAALLVLLLPGALSVGCETAYPYIGGALIATAIGAQSPSHEIEQVYYLGVFDPQEQVPSQVYRLTVRGQASFMSNTKFASGWVPAQLIDSLNSGPRFNDAGGIDAPTAAVGAVDAGSELGKGRRMVMFGPEGFREAPRDHRLVIVMGANPDAFFQAMDQALGTVAEAQLDNQNAEVRLKMSGERARLEEERTRLDALKRRVDADLPEPTES